MSIIIDKYPALKFKYSRIYNSTFKNYIPDNKKSEIPSWKKVLDRKKDLEKYWDKNGKNILKTISKVSGLKWKEKYIDVYINACSPVFSNPLTLSIARVSNYEDKNMKIDLIHELIHVILTQNYNSKSSIVSWIDENYFDEDRITRVHIEVHAVETGVLLSIGMEKELNDSIKRCKSKVYRRSWDIVDKEGWENIVRKLKK